MKYLTHFNHKVVEAAAQNMLSQHRHSNFVIPKDLAGILKEKTASEIRTAFKKALENTKLA